MAMSRLMRAYVISTLKNWGNRGEGQVVFRGLLQCSGKGCIIQSILHPLVAMLGGTASFLEYLAFESRVVFSAIITSPWNMYKQRCEVWRFFTPPFTYVNVFPGYSSHHNTDTELIWVSLSKNAIISRARTRKGLWPYFGTVSFFCFIRRAPVLHCRLPAS